jgi:hypothetical protein
MRWSNESYEIDTSAQEAAELQDLRDNGYSESQIQILKELFSKTKTYFVPWK